MTTTTEVSTVTKSVSIKQEMNFKMPSFQMQFMKLVNSAISGMMEAWVTIQLTQMSVWRQKCIYDEQMVMEIQNFTVRDNFMIINNMILEQQIHSEKTIPKKKKPAIMISQKKQDKPSARYFQFNGLKHLIEVQLEGVMLNWMPQTVNGIFKILRATRQQTMPV